MSSISFNSCSAPFSAGVRLLCFGLVVLVAVWTSFLTKSIKDSKVVFLLGFGIHEKNKKYIYIR
jgi:tetrahydromethanopterin S-methyltransferase subunit E